MVNKTIRVVAAILIDWNKNQVLATQRGYGEFKGLWEFPGGKIEPGETAEKALVREIQEELDCEISVGDLFCTVEYDYPEFHLSMNCFLCHFKSNKIILKEHLAARMLSFQELDSVQWLPADVQIIEQLKLLGKRVLLFPDTKTGKDIL